MNKAAIALVIGVLCWLVYFAGQSAEFSSSHFAEQMSDIAQIIFFLLAAMTIVELIDSHQGFKLVTDLLYT
ncbi:MAG: sodium:proton antiporter, partial [Chlamydiia bacterium]|nr:sodium:proton antiporter [Chlamydiia bacterium]